MSADYPINDADETLALRLIGWIVADMARADRMLALTGLAPDDLRDSLSHRATLAALMDFVINHEPDLIACADALEVKPAALVAARRRITPDNTK
jgi:hypothetical protein